MCSAWWRYGPPPGSADALHRAGTAARTRAFWVAIMGLSDVAGIVPASSCGGRSSLDDPDRHCGAIRSCPGPCDASPCDDVRARPGDDAASSPGHAGSARPGSTPPDDDEVDVDDD